MSSDKALYERWISELWAGKPVAADIVSDDFVGHWPDRDVHGPAELQAIVDQTHAMFSELLSGTGAATWTEPKGGYFISLDVMDGCAKRVVSLAKEAGITIVPAGQTFPYSQDPRDSNIRLAPSFPSETEVEQAAEGIALCTLLAASEKILAERGARA